MSEERSINLTPVVIKETTVTTTARVHLNAEQIEELLKLAVFPTASRDEVNVDVDVSGQGFLRGATVTHTIVTTARE